MYAIVRRSFSVLALLSILLSAQGGLVTHLLFQAWQTHIAHHLCENRHKPGSKCNGMCFLKKRLAETEQKGEHNHAPQQALSPVLFFTTSTTDEPVQRPASRRTYVCLDERSPRDEHRVRIDHPPRIL